MKKIVSTVSLILVMAAGVAGCSSTQKSASAIATGGGALNKPSGRSGAGTSGSAKAGPASYIAVPISSQTTTAAIHDPAMNNELAVNMIIPARWKLQGIMQGNPCAMNGFPWAVYRAYSPDGLMQVVSEPLFGWRWTTNAPATKPAPGCANISQKISAANFIQYYVGTLQEGVHTVGPMPVPAWVQQQTQQSVTIGNQTIQKLKAQSPAFDVTVSGDTAALRIETVNGAYILEERIAAGVVCSINNKSLMGRAANSCWALLVVWSAPEGQLDAMLQNLDGRNLPTGTLDPQWAQKWIQQNRANTAKAMQAFQQQAARNSQTLYNQFVQSMQRQEREYQQFTAQQQSRFNSEMNYLNGQMNAQSTRASDWVDYALDQQTVVGPSGVPTKVSSSYSQTWTNGTQWYQTNDPNANPNGVLQGNWTSTTQVHGNGTPK